ncbi:TPA: hypothetical protein N0F65_009159 [Lagenidium giganteum]|uniref:CDAN1-interacting nuclease 1 n=1 Tax=Lagenidium giganteum TaxID=4803 RepID=A0AAV2YPW5_9STRA|nr:TPA: hypothetical protein N0F65_009159 [Lagenidium giganteum]
MLAPFAFFSTSTSSGPGVNVHKPVPAKVRRKLSKRQKKKDTKATVATVVVEAADGSAASSAPSTAAAPTTTTAATPTVTTVVRTQPQKPSTKPNNRSKKASEEALLASAAKNATSASTGPAKKPVANVAASVAEATTTMTDKAVSTAAAPTQQTDSAEVVSNAAKPKRTQVKVEKPAEVKAPEPAQVSLPKKYSTGPQKITMTLKEIKALQETLPSVDEIATLVERLRKESFQKGHTLFDLYRNYGNPFLDETFLKPGVLACCEAKRPAEGIRIVRDMLNQGRKVDEETLRALFDVCDSAAAGKEAIELWELMERAGFKADLRDLNRFLDICYRSEYLDGAIAVLKQLRLHRPVSIHTYMHWLLRSSLVWRSDAFFDLLMEMRLSGVEPEILSLTSLEPGRMDRALTVMEGVRAVGLDPCFAMSTVYSSMQYSVYKNGPAVAPITAKAIQKAKAKFGDLRAHNIDWPVKPIPQLLETQAAGLILQQETFRRLKLRQVHRIDELLKMLPITTNMTINLRKQLQRMSLLVNTHRVRRDVDKISNEFYSGKSLIELSNTHNYPPVSLMRIILRARGYSSMHIKRALAQPQEHLSKRDQHELKKAIEYDSVHRSDPFIGTASYNATSLEDTIVSYFKSKGIRVKTEKELGSEQIEKYGRRVISPDILLLDPVIINGTPVRWIDAKNYYGAHIVSKRLISKQLESYVSEWGPGAIVFGMGYSDMFSVPGVICLDTTPLPTKTADKIKMHFKAFFYTCINPFRWSKHLGSELTNDYPVTLPSVSRELQTSSPEVLAKMLARQTARVFRAPAQRRAVSNLVDKPSNVAADQKLFTTSHQPTYLKRDSDKVIFAGLLGLFGVGMLQFVRGEVNMARGVTLPPFTDLHGTPTTPEHGHLHRIRIHSFSRDLRANAGDRRNASAATRVSYVDAYNRFMALDNPLAPAEPNSQAFQDELTSVLALLKQALKQRAGDGVLSDNESFFELQNDQIYAFLVEYALAMLVPRQTFFQQQEREGDGRAAARSSDGSRDHAQARAHEQNLVYRVRFLQEADVYHTQFLDRCEAMGILTEKKRREQYERMESGKYVLSREDKIQRFQLQRELEQKLEHVRRKKLEHRPKHEGADKNVQKNEEDDDEFDVDDEVDELEREQLMAFTQLAVIKSMEEQTSINQEREMLETMLKMNAASVNRDLFTDAHRPPPPKQGQGITVTHINPQLEMRRETIQSGVFKPGHRLPTMSLEEYADQQVADAKERQKREQEAPTGPRRYDQLVEDGDEDNLELVDEATYKDRAWDDWKDANPRGIGNKKGSQF